MNPIFLTIMKRLRFTFFLSGVAFFIQSCGEDDQRPNEVLMTVNIDVGYFPEEFDYWIFISDKNGKTIDVRQATDSTFIKFLGPQQSTMTMTIFTRVAYTSSSNGSIRNSFVFNSYQEIASGSTIYLKKGTSYNLQIPDVIGSVPYTLHDYDDSDRPEDALIFTDGTSSSYSVLDFNSTVYTETKFSAKLKLRENPSRILVTTYHDDVPVHQWLNDVKPGQGIEVSYDSFLPSKTITVNKKITAGQVSSISGADFSIGYNFCLLYTRQISKSSNLSRLPKLGYLDGFEKYFVSVHSNPFNYATNLSYTKVGTVPQSINLPDYTYSIENDNLYDLSLKFSNDYSYKQAYFLKSNKETQVYWNLNASNKENFKAPSIPSQIKKFYPMLNLDGLKLEFATYTHFLDGYTYSGFISDHFGSTRREVYEELRYVFKP